MRHSHAHNGTTPTSASQHSQHSGIHRWHYGTNRTPCKMPDERINYVIHLTCGIRLSRHILLSRACGRSFGSKPNHFVLQNFSVAPSFVFACMSCKLPKLAGCSKRSRHTRLTIREWSVHTSAGCSMHCTTCSPACTTHVLQLLHPYTGFTLGTAGGKTQLCRRSSTIAN